MKSCPWWGVEIKIIRDKQESLNKLSLIFDILKIKNKLNINENNKVISISVDLSKNKKSPIKENKKILSKTVVLLSIRSRGWKILVKRLVLVKKQYNKIPAKIGIDEYIIFLYCFLTRYNKNKA